MRRLAHVQPGARQISMADYNAMVDVVNQLMSITAAGPMGVQATPHGVSFAGRRRRQAPRAPVPLVPERLYVVSVESAEWTLECQHLDTEGEPTGEPFTVQTFTHDVSGLTWPDVDPPIAAEWRIPAAQFRPDNEWYCLWRIMGTC